MLFAFCFRGGDQQSKTGVVISGRRILKLTESIANDALVFPQPETERGGGPFSSRSRSSPRSWVAGESKVEDGYCWSTLGRPRFLRPFGLLGF